MLLWLVAAASAIALRPLWLALAPHLRPCIFRTITGLPCPTCGTTRAAVAFLHGDLVSAFASNPLATLTGILFIAGAPIAALWVVSDGPGVQVPQAPPQLLRWVLLGMIALNWLWVIFAS